MMQIQRLGRSGLTASELCIGTMLFGRATEGPEARRILAEGTTMRIGVTL